MSHSLLRISLSLAVLLQGMAATAEEAPPVRELRRGWFHDPWRTNDGLPNNDVTGVVQVTDGALVVGTQSGMARFDGLRFRELDLKVSGGDADTISGVCLGPHGSFWFLCRGHAAQRMPDGSVRSVALPPSEPGSRLSAMFVTSDEVLWLSYDTGRLLRLTDGKVTPAQVDPNLPSGFSSMATADAKGNVWAGGPGGLARWNGGKFVRVAALPPRKAALTAARDGGLWIGSGPTLLRYTEEGGVVQMADIDLPRVRTRIATMLEDSSGFVWCGTFIGGLHCWNGKTFERVNVAHHDVWALAEDLERNIWVGTGGNGLVRVRPRVLTPLNELGGPLNHTPRSLCVDANQQVWVAVQTGDLHIRGAKGWRQVDLARELRTTGVTCVAADDKGAVWVACADNKVARWDGTSFIDAPLPPARKGGVRAISMMVARDGTLWLGRGDEVVHQTPGGWKSFNQSGTRENVSVLAQDRAGDIWVGTARGSLLRVEAAGLVAHGGDRGGGGIRSLLAAPDGALWIARARKLERLKSGRWSEVTAAHGLSGGAISQLTLDDRDRMWIGVDQGLLLAQLRDLNDVADGRAARIHFSPYVTGGLQAGAGYTPNTALMKGDWLWYCSRAGVVTADLRAAGSNTVAPKVSIESMSVDGKKQPTAGGLKLGPRPGEISFELGAMSFRLPEQVRVYHRIEGVDRDWVEAGQDRIAHYPRLPAGNHVLQVRAINEDGVSSERDATLAFEVVPTFKETKFFRLITLLLCILGVFLATRFYLMRKVRRETRMLRDQLAVHGERVRIARDMHDQLGASLTQISLITDLMQAENAGDKRISQLGRTARQASASLDEIVWAVNPRHDHLGSVLEYLGQQAVNLLDPAGLRCRLDFPEEPPEHHLPAEFRHQLFLIVREALNNVIRHAAAKEVTFSASVSESDLRLVITDDGRGGAAQAGGDGLYNMRSRAEALGGDCAIRNAPGGGTTVELQVPWPRRQRSS